MHSVLWASILASAGVALVTTLLVEYLAKPGLEARKERILEKRRSHRAALRDLNRVFFLARNVFSVLDDQDMPVIRSKLVDYSRDIESLMLDVYDNLLIPAALHQDWSNAARDSMTFAIVVRERALDEKYREKFIRAYDRLNQYYFLADTASWRYCKRRKLIRGIESAPLRPRDAGSQAKGRRAVY